MNIWTFTGRLGADAEFRSTKSGEKVLGFRVANDVGFGERKTTQWVDCSIWGRRAEVMAPHLSKGKSVIISGEVILREFEKRDGTRGAQMHVRVAELDFMGGPGEEGSHESGGGHRGADDGSRGGGHAREGGAAGSGGKRVPGEVIPFVHSDESFIGAERFGKIKPIV